MLHNAYAAFHQGLQIALYIIDQIDLKKKKKNVFFEIITVPP